MRSTLKTASFRYILKFNFALAKEGIVDIFFAARGVAVEGVVCIFFKYRSDVICNSFFCKDLHQLKILKFKKHHTFFLKVNDTK
jgi:hypothetical protein